jgi:hypothetical protein
MNSTFTKFMCVESELSFTTPIMNGAEFSKRVAELLAKVPSNFVVTVKGHDGSEISKESVSGKPVKESKRKIKRKRGLTSYLAFVKDQRSTIAKDGMSPQNVMRAVAQKWKTLTDEEKAPYVEMARKDREAKALEAGIDVSKKSKRKIKRAATGYICYTKATRAIVSAEDPTLSPQEVTKVMAGLWTALDAEGRKPYMEEAALDKQRWLKEKEQFAKEEAEAAEAAEEAAESAE